MTTNQTESILRLARRNLFIVLLLILLLGGTLLSNVFQPDSPFSRWPSELPWLLPVGMVILFTTSMARVRWDPQSPEVRAILSDEWRRLNLHRAMRIAFFIVLIAQVPQTFLFMQLPVLRALMGMATATITLAMSAFLALFLIFDRDTSHE